MAIQQVRELTALWQIATGQVQVDTAGQTTAQKRAWWEITGILGTTFIVLIGAMFVMLNESFDESAKKWASAVIGGVIGYWLK